ncbi:class I SAM-dependent methyltransferase [Paenibacillus sp. WLX1005]|uniref:class I SAM-dependent methyltransferase n=1 Tax=Paenibacillus sp. WLX1005 TaxID=3243766 RepID=UPI003983FBB8
MQQQYNQPSMSWQSEVAGKYHQTIANKIPAYPVLYELSGRILEAGMNKREQSTRIPSTHQGSLNSPNPNIDQKQSRHIAVIGAGGGQELVTWAARYEHWQCTGVDTSTRMLATAQQRVHETGVAHRCHLYQGSVEHLPSAAASATDVMSQKKQHTGSSTETSCYSEASLDSEDSLDSESFLYSETPLHSEISRYSEDSSQRSNADWNTFADPSLYDAASCILVLHFLPDSSQQQDMLNKLVASVKPGAPIVVACLSGMPEEGETNWVMQAWHEHMRDHHISDEDWYTFVDSIGVTSYPPEVQQMEQMLSSAGLVDVRSYFQTLFTQAWCGRRAWEGEQTI